MIDTAKVGNAHCARDEKRLDAGKNIIQIIQPNLKHKSAVTEQYGSVKQKSYYTQRAVSRGGERKITAPKAIRGTMASIVPCKYFAGTI